ncbi:MAG: alpha-amylase, partial [Spirochaetaceae bacterium]
MRSQAGAWFEKAFFYHIYPLGFCGAPARNSAEAAGSRLGPLHKVIPHLRELGCTAVYLGPVFASHEHGYDTSDYYHIDARLGSNEEFRELVGALHAVDIRVVLDGVFNHVGRQFWAFRDLQEHGENSAYRDWFKGVDFSTQSPYGDAFSYTAWEGHFELVSLNHQNPELRQHLFGAVDWMIDELGIDGLRLDVAYLLPKDFLRELRSYTRAKRQDFYLLGEVIHGDYSEYLGPELLDSVTNYECYKGLWSSLNDGNYHEIGHSIGRQFGDAGPEAASAGSRAAAVHASAGGGNGHWSGISHGHHLYNFVDNHDVDRAASVLADKNYLHPLYGLLMTMPGAPSLYYGSEFGLPGSTTAGGDAALRPAWSEVERQAGQASAAS